MNVYKIIYAFEAADALADGKKVQVLDRKAKVVRDCAEMKAAAFVYAVNCKEKGRFEFWYSEEAENDNER